MHSTVKTGYTPVMDTSPQMRRWVEGWIAAGPALDRIRIDELRRMTPETHRRATEAHRRAIEALLDLGYRFRQPRRTSGLVEQQALLHKAHV